VEVTYTARGYGYYPEAIFKYVLETGAGWNDTIGSVDIVVQLPYEASESNLFVHESNVTGQSTPGGVISGNEIRWHYEDLEPTWESNIEVILIAPALWESVLKETETVTGNPKDGEAWGRLAKAYKGAARLPKGWLRDDPAGRDMLELSKDAYEKCLALLPQDPLWHYGYADLLWSEYYWEVRASRKGDTQGLLPRALTELQTTLALDPDNGLAKDLLTEISVAVEGAVELNGGKYVFLALTATPLPPTAYGEDPTETPWVAATGTVKPGKSGDVPIVPSSPEPTAWTPLCGGAALFAGLPVTGLILRHRRRFAQL
jgi:tetratricopeptide (TPR) repeat protein